MFDAAYRDLTESSNRSLESDPPKAKHVKTQPSVPREVCQWPGCQNTAQAGKEYCRPCARQIADDTPDSKRKVKREAATTAGLSPVEHKFIKSKLNAGTEAEAHEFVLQDRRFQKPDTETKNAILRGLGLDHGAWGARTFDLIMTDPPVRKPITARNVGSYLDRITLIEVKSTRSSTVRDIRLNNFFYGSTEKQYDLASAAGDRMLFAFVVLTESNVYGKPFFALMSFEEVGHRTKRKRIQFQVNFRSDMDSSDDVLGPFPMTDPAH